MPDYLISPIARDDMEEILVWTEKHFGSQARSRYAPLLIRAIKDVAERPKLAGSHARAELGTGVRSYHLAHSRNHVSPREERVRQPRHLLLYRVREESLVEIGRVLHDSMETERNLPEGFRD